MAKRLESRYTTNPVTGCWEWNGSIRRDGYGRWNFQSKTQLAHRVMFFVIKGYWPKLKLDHKCRNRKCVNPEHTEDTTSAINNQRGLKAKLSQEQVNFIRASYTGARGERVYFMRKFDISSSQFGRIKRNVSWVKE
jgi:hypothetical protein